MTGLLIKAYIPSLYDELGIYIPLTVVHCIILGRAEAYANKHTPLLSVMDGVGMGLGFTVALTLAGAIREILGTGRSSERSCCGRIRNDDLHPASGPSWCCADYRGDERHQHQDAAAEAGGQECGKGNCALCATAGECETKTEKEPAAKEEAKTEKGGEQS